VVNVALNLWLIPIYGALGCAAATLLTEIVLAAWMAVRARGLVVGVGFLGAVGRVSVAAGAMAAALVVLPPVHVVVDVLVGAVVFVAAGRATGAWSPADLRRLRRV
jgi:O-antigen/teichoic acid export membrane protein